MKIASGTQSLQLDLSINMRRSLDLTAFPLSSSWEGKYKQNKAKGKREPHRSRAGAAIPHPHPQKDTIRGASRPQRQ